MADGEEPEETEVHAGEVSEKRDVSPVPSEGHGYVTLPIGEGEFKDFIQSLLGSPQAIRRHMSGVFEIEQATIRELHFLLVQRVEQQNQGGLVQFLATITYNDGSSVELESLDEVMTYNEIRSVVSCALHLRWDFLVRFQDKSVPERQRIEITFGESEFFQVDDAIPFNVRFRGYSSGSIGLRIEYTARTWGTDIESLLTNYLEGLKKPTSRCKSLVRKHSGRISFGVAATFFLASLAVSFGVTKAYAGRQVGTLRASLKAIAGAEPAGVSQQIQLLADFLAGGVWSLYYFGLLVFVISSFVIAIALAIWVETSASTDEPSFLLLTKASRDYRTKMLERRRKKWLSFCASVVSAIVIGVVSNWLFYSLFLVE